MIIYTYQPQSLIDEINSHGHAFVEFTKTNLYRQTKIPGKNMEAYHEAYVWMGRKLSEKTGVWMNDVYGDDLYRKMKMVTILVIWGERCRSFPSGDGISLMGRIRYLIETTPSMGAEKMTWRTGI